jgi:hypothetical protein
MDLHQYMADPINVPVMEILISRRDSREDFGNERAEILAHYRIQDFSIAP